MLKEHLGFLKIVFYAIFQLFFQHRGRGKESPVKSCSNNQWSSSLFYYADKRLLVIQVYNMGWFCTHLTTKNLKFVKIFKKTAKKWHFLRCFGIFFHG